MLSNTIDLTEPTARSPDLMETLVGPVGALAILVEPSGSACRATRGRPFRSFWLGMQFDAAELMVDAARYLSEAILD